MFYITFSVEFCSCYEKRLCILRPVYWKWLFNNVRKCIEIFVSERFRRKKEKMVLHENYCTYMLPDSISSNTKFQVCSLLHETFMTASHFVSIAFLPSLFQPRRAERKGFLVEPIVAIATSRAGSPWSEKGGKWINRLYLIPIKFTFLLFSQRQSVMFTD